MNFVEHNFVSNEEAKNILEAYGYEVKDAVVEESAKEEAVITAKLVADAERKKRLLLRTHVLLYVVILRISYLNLLKLLTMLSLSKFSK